MKYRKITFIITEPELLKLNKMKEINSHISMSSYIRNLINNDYNLYNEDLKKELEIDFFKTFGQMKNEKFERRFID